MSKYQFEAQAVILFDSEKCLDEFYNPESDDWELETFRTQATIEVWYRGPRRDTVEEARKDLPLVAKNTGAFQGKKRLLQVAVVLRDR